MSRAFIESYSEYLSGRGRSAVSVLNRVAAMTLPAYRATGEHVPTMYYNNLACIHHYLNKPNVACYYLRRATAEKRHGPPRRRRPRPKVGRAAGVCTVEMSGEGRLFVTLTDWLFVVFVYACSLMMVRLQAICISRYVFGRGIYDCSYIGEFLFPAQNVGAIF